MAGTILKGKFVMTPEGPKEGYAVKVEGNRITFVGPESQVRASDGDQVIELGNQAVLPGFVNGHNHMYGVLSHGITAETMVTDFSNFLEDFWWPCVEDRMDHDLARITAKWACVEMIESGVTSFVDILEGPNSIPGALFAEKEAVEQAGLRGWLSFEACERMSPENGRLGLEENLKFAKACSREGGLVNGLMSIHTLFTCSKDFIQEAKRMAADAGSMLHMHLSESDFEPAWSREQYNEAPVKVYEGLHCLDETVLASQLVQVSDEEIEALARLQVKGVSMPLSNCEVGGGVAPVGAMIEKGMTVGLGTDGYVNNFFEVMRGAFLIHKAHLKDPQAMPAKLVYRMATELGAQAIGMGGQAGTIKEGMLADIITVSLDRPTPVNAHNIYDQLVLFTNPSDVVNVMVDGVWLKRDHRLLTIDKEAVRRELSKATEAFWNIQGEKGEENAIN